MKDFLKIFSILSLVIGAFIFGRVHGEEKFRDSEEFQNLVKKQVASEFKSNDLENMRARFQNIIDGSESKKSEELLGQVLQVLTNDLGLKIQDHKAFTKPNPFEAAQPRKEFVPTKSANSEVEKPTRKKPAVRDPKKFSSHEWILINSQNKKDIQSNLKNVEIQDIDQFLKTTTPTSAQQLQPIFGSYRGRIYDINKNEFATMAFEVNPTTKDGRTLLVGSIKLFKGGQETMASQFSTEQLGYSRGPSTGILINQESHYFQTYKIVETNQIAGFFYDRSVNGTTHTIGHFLLNRVDQF